MIWATVSSQACFCSLYRASPLLAAKNIINLISVLTIWWCPCVESTLVLRKSVFAMTSAFSWHNIISLCPASFCIQRPNLPVVPGVSWLPTFAFQSPIMKRTSSFVLVLKDLVGLHRTVQLQLLQHYWTGHRLGLPWFALEMNRDHSVVSEIASKNCISDSFVDYDGYSIFSKGFLPTVVDIMVIWGKFTHSS